MTVGTWKEKYRSWDWAAREMAIPESELYESVYVLHDYDCDVDEMDPIDHRNGRTLGVFRSSAIAEQARVESEAEDPTHDLAVTEVKIYDAVPESYSVIALSAYMRPHPIRLEFETESRVWHWWDGEARSPVLTSSWLVGVDEYIKKMPEYNLERQLVVAAFGPVQYRDVLETEFNERLAEWASTNGVEIPKH